jgi:D-inositol-3-phosphate glycosyltransferase
MAVNVGGVSEVVINGETGVLVDGHNKNTFADKLCEILNRQPECRRLGGEAYRFAKQHYSQGASVSAVIELYDRILNAPGNSRPKVSYTSKV